MKKLSVILATPVIMALTMVCIINTSAQDTNSKIYMDISDQNWPSASELMIAYHDLPKQPTPWENLNIYEILDFIDDSIQKGTLLGYESDPIYGEDTSAGDRLNILKDKIDMAAHVLENGSFEEACQHLLNAYLSTDGLSQTPDLVYGQAAAELANKIKLMRIEIIGCE